MEQYARPATLDDLKSLIQSLNNQNADYLLIGGYALFAHGYHRAATVIYALVPATHASGIKVREALMVLPDRAAQDLDPVWFKDVSDRIILERALEIYSRNNTSNFA